MHTRAPVVGSLQRGPVERPPRVAMNMPIHGRRTPKHFVFHTTEGYGSIESLAKFFSGTPDRLGVNYAIQPNGRCGSVGDFYAETYHVLAHNSECIGVEQIGFAATTQSKWLNAYQPQLTAAAWIAAWASQQLDIPLIRSAEGRKWTAPSGFCQHSDVPDNDHVDCGPGYPFEMVLERAQAFAEHGVPTWAKRIVPKR